MALTTLGTLWSWGNNTGGQLGLSNTTNRSSPVQVGTLSLWTQVIGGTENTIAIQTPGTLWAWGFNNAGQLGLNDTVNRSSPVQVGTLSTWTRIAAGDGFSSARQNTGTLWSWGTNSFGRLGLNTSTNYSSPVRLVGSLTGTWNQVSSNGSLSSMAIISPGSLWAWGNNSFGQLGIGPVGFNAQFAPQQAVGQFTTWTQVSMGATHAAGIQTPGTLWLWGSNSFGQLGTNTTSFISVVSPVQVGALSVWTLVSSGNEFTSAIQRNGTLWAWGRNNFGQLGLSDTANRSSPVQVGVLNSWTQLSCGYRSMSAVQSNGTLWSWGNNSWGQLGLNDVTHRSSPVQVGALSVWTQIACGYFNAFAVTSLGTLWAWGVNSFGQLGLSNTTHRSSPVQVGSLSTWTVISPSFLNTAGIFY
jgi:alpha-tubulin suppressor-like RCC1 family protein